VERGRGGGLEDHSHARVRSSFREPTRLWPTAGKGASVKAQRRNHASKSMSWIRALLTPTTFLGLIEHQASWEGEEEKGSLPGVPE